MYVHGLFVLKQWVVEKMGEAEVMVILDNHMTKPGWCCSNDDGNGFFGDRDFDPEMWVDGLTKMATLFKGVKNVVGMSLRNELRGPKQNVNDWYRYVRTSFFPIAQSGFSTYLSISIVYVSELNGDPRCLRPTFIHNS